MSNDLPQPIPQGEYGAYAPQTSRMAQVADLLRRSRLNDEAQHGDGAAYRGSLYDEQEIVEGYAETHSCWFSLEQIFDLGTPGPSGSENDTYVDKAGGTVYKTNNLIHTGSYYKLFKRLQAHNSLFPQTAYELIGFTGFKGRTVYPLLAQRYIENVRPATPQEIDDYMRALGFEKCGDWTFRNENYVISDLKPKNVLCDTDGDLYVVDAEISTNPPEQVTR